MVSQQTKKWFRNLNLHNDNVLSTRLEEVLKYAQTQKVQSILRQWSRRPAQCLSDGSVTCILYQIPRSSLQTCEGSTPRVPNQVWVLGNW